MAAKANKAKNMFEILDTEDTEQNIVVPLEKKKKESGNKVSLGSP
jgi:hypothetical protein